MEKLRDFTGEIEKCVRCGTCRSTCPTFRVLGRESACARGKLALIGAYLNGEIPGSPVYARHIKECALCGACKDSCPNGVDTVGVFVAARAELVEKEGLPFVASFVMKSLLEPGRLMPVALRLASRLQGLILKDSSVESGLLSRFSLPVIGGGGGAGNSRLLPPLAKRFFLDMPDVRALSGVGVGAGQAKVAFYAGCGVNYLMPETGLSSIEALKKAGASVTVPAAQICCGMPAYSMGDVATARGMALKNLEVFEQGEYDFIVTSCATCGYGLKTMFKKLLGDDPSLKDRLEAFSSKVRDISELLVNVLGYKGHASWPSSGKKRTVTYHDPCHLNRAQGIRREPRELISSAPGVRFKEMKFPCSCCGLGGGLSTTNYELSIEITRRKAESVKASGAEVLATSCPGCIVQLRDAMHRYGVDVLVVHVVDLL